MAKKKLTKKEKQRLAEAEAKRKAAEEEAERLRIQKEEKERLKREAKEAKERAEREVAEHHIRFKNLRNSCKLFEEHKEIKLQQDIALREAEEWKLYLECNGLPNPGILSEMNTYLFLWKLDTKTNFIEDNLPKTQEVLNLLKVLDNLIDNPLNNTKKQVDNWKEVRDDFRVELQDRLDKSSFHLLRQLETNMTLVDLEMVTYLKECPYLTLCMWSVLKIPRAFNDSRPPPFIEFPQVGVSIQLPPRFTHSFPVVRALWLKYDHFSDICPTWEAKPLPEEYMGSLNDLINEEWEEKQKIKSEQDAEDAARLEKMKKKTKKKHHQPPPEVTEAGTQSDIGMIAPGIESKLMEGASPTDTAKPEEQPLEEKPPPRKKPSEIMEEKELARISHLRSQLELTVEPGELNMRRSTVLGGVFHLDLLEQPPQPKILADRTLLTVLEGDYKLQHVDYHEEYKVTLPENKDPASDETDAETKAKLESEQLKLVAINIALPESVLWFEPPTAVQWNSKKKIWTTADIHDPKFNEEKQILSFKTGRMAPVGLSTFRFVNLPYQTWELRPDWKGPPGGIFFSITAATVIVEFIIKANQVCLNQLQNATSTALQEIVGIFYPPHQLIRLMRQGGIDLFPQHDAYLYVEGVTQKHFQAENHLYNCMALFSSTYNFSWSRWNLLAGRNNMVMQVREFIDRKRLPNYQMLLVTPLKAIIVDCTEVSAAFSHQGVEGMQFYPDLYMLVSEHASSLSKEKIANIDLALVQTVYQILSNVRVFSYS